MTRRGLTESQVNRSMTGKKKRGIPMVIEHQEEKVTMGYRRRRDRNRIREEDGRTEERGGEEQRGKTNNVVYTLVPGWLVCMRNTQAHKEF